MAFAEQGAALLAVHAAAQEELARTGVTLTDIARMYAEVDGEAAGTLEMAGGQFVGQPFTASTGLARGEALPRRWLGGPHTAAGRSTRLGPHPTGPQPANASHGCALGGAAGRRQRGLDGVGCRRGPVRFAGAERVGRWFGGAGAGLLITDKSGSTLEERELDGREPGERLL